MRTRALLIPGLAAAITAIACESYVPPPTPVILGLDGNTLSDARYPVAVWFEKSIDPATLRLKVAYYDTNLEGQLPDEDDDPNTELRVIVSHDPDDGDHGGRVDLNAAGDIAAVAADGSLPVGPKLALIVEGGLVATDGRVRNNRTVIPFSYAVKCSAGATGKLFPSGVYFFLLDVQEPLGTQIQLLAAMDVDPATGQMIAQVSNADRNPDASRCPTPCGPADACRLLPSPACVPPSTKAGTVEEYSDFVPNPTPPTGYSFTITGCAVDDPGGKGAGLVTLPATMVVESPPVTVAGLEMTSFFAPDDKGVIRATGTLTAESVALGGNVIGPGKGTMSAILVPEAEVPPGVPRPTPLAPPASNATATDAGAP
jgi:hypothetical protein